MTHDQRERLQGRLHGLQSAIQFRVGCILAGVARIRIEIGQGLNERGKAAEREFREWVELNRQYLGHKPRRRTCKK